MIEDILDKIINDYNVILTEEEIECLKKELDETIEEIKKNQGQDIDIEYSLISKSIIATRDKEFIKKCVEEECFRFEDYQYQELLLATQDENLIKEKIISRETSTDLKYWLLKEWALQAKDIGEYIVFLEKALKNQDISFSSEYKEGLIKSLKTNPNIKETGYINLVRRWIKDSSLELTSSSKTNILITLKDLEFMQQPVNNPEYPEFEGFSRYEVDIIRYMRAQNVMRNIRIR